jgi:hypothetical protein
LLCSNLPTIIDPSRVWLSLIWAQLEVYASRRASRLLVTSILKNKLQTNGIFQTGTLLSDSVGGIHRWANLKEEEERAERDRKKARETEQKTAERKNERGKMGLTPAN